MKRYMLSSYQTLWNFWISEVSDTCTF